MQTPLLSGFQVLKTRDLDEARVEVGRVFCPHTLKPGLKATGDGVVFNHAPLNKMSVNWVDYGRDVQIAPVPFESFYLLQVVSEGRASIACGPAKFEVEPGRASLINPDDQLVMDWGSGCRKLILRIERAAFERFAEQWFGCYLPAGLVFDNELCWNSDHLRSARTLVDLIATDLECEQGTLRNREAQKHFEDALLSSLLVGQRHNFSHLLDVHSPAVPRVVKRAEEYIAAHAEDDVTISDLVVASGASTRTLFESFRKFRGVTPMQYLRRYRLEKVREELLRAGPEGSVTELALKWNFEQLGRFASYYASIYGERPSDTLRRGRGPS
jgi:AraC-like DNA-binding protein